MEARVIEVESKRAKEEEEKHQLEEVVEEPTKDVVMEEQEVISEQETVVEEADVPQTDNSPSQESAVIFSPKLSYVETFDIGSKDESLEDN
jgi:hypothetical protein